MLHKGRYKTWKTSNEALSDLSFTTGKMKILFISREKRRKDAAVLRKVSWLSDVMVCIEISSQGLTKPLFVEPKPKIDV
ncbi:hypothetical protein TNCV_4385991 [Trichonephila clavipes]|nr:hypothetical protein TNCV_4385991 [Trichonephila clavipes]